MDMLMADKNVHLIVVMRVQRQFGLSSSPAQPRMENHSPEAAWNLSAYPRAGLVTWRILCG